MPCDRSGTGTASAHRAGARRARPSGGAPLPVRTAAGKRDSHDRTGAEAAEKGGHGLACGGLPGAGGGGRRRRCSVLPGQRRGFGHLPGCQSQRGAGCKPAGEGGLGRSAERGRQRNSRRHGPEGGRPECGGQRHHGLSAQARLCGRTGQLHPHLGGGRRRGPGRSPGAEADHGNRAGARLRQSQRSDPLPDPQWGQRPSAKGGRVWHLAGQGHADPVPGGQQQPSHV